MPNDEDKKRRQAQFIARVWADEGFRQRVMHEPTTALKEFGFEIPEGKEVRIIEADPDKTVYFIIPVKPADLLLDTNLDEAAIDQLHACLFETRPCV